MRFGSGFNASKPSEGDFVRRPTGPQLATELRLIRQRILDFFGVLFQTDAPDFKDDVIPSAALTNSPSKPDSGGRFYTRVTVEKRGFVTKGSYDAVYNTPRLYRAIYTAAGATIESPQGPVVVAAATKQLTPRLFDQLGQTFTPEGYKYEFIVPDGVTRVRLTLVGGGQRGDGPTASSVPIQDSWHTNILSFAVTPKEAYFVFVGARYGSSVFANAGFTRWGASGGTNYAPLEGQGAGQEYDYHTFVPTTRPRFRGFGGRTESGLVLIEWYA